MAGNMREILAAARAKNDEPEVETPPATPEAQATRGRGRPATGKRSDPDYERSGVLIRKATRKRTATLLLNYPDKDFSELVEELLRAWNNSQPE